MYVYLLKKARFVVLLLAMAQTGFSQQTASDTLRLFLIGNSFSQNASRYLPQLATEGGHTLVLGRAELGGCSLQRHWQHVEAYEANALDPKGRPYKGKSLSQLLSQGTWDVVTLQQYSMHSADPATYEPYASKLYAYIKKIQPKAEVVFHQTWAYRSDADGFGQTAAGQTAQTGQEMWEKSRAAYRQQAAKHGLRVLPVGDAFQESNRIRPYKKDPSFTPESATYPTLPSQDNSLHVGYHWTKDQKLGFDSHHANAAGCFLGSLVWYTALFGQSPQSLTYVPEGVEADFAQHLKKVAATTVRKSARK